MRSGGEAPQPPSAIERSGAAGQPGQRQSHRRLERVAQPRSGNSGGLRAVDLPWVERQ